MKSLTNVATFIRVAESQSFVQAANDLGLSPPAVSKAIAKLEAELGVKLLHRTTRSVSLTAEGERFYDGVKPLIEEMTALTTELTKSLSEPQGRLKISMGSAYGRIWGTWLMPMFLKTYPRISVELSLDDRDIDLAAEGVDVALRIGALPDSANLMARRLFTDPLIVCATPDYLEQAGYPSHPDDLVHFNCLNFRNRKTGRPMPWLFTVDGSVERRLVSGNLTIDDGEAVGRSAIAGVGISQMPGYMATEALEQGHLTEVLQEYRPPEAPITALYLDRRLVAPRIRAFIDFMVRQSRTSDAALPI
ncbi:LysR family transcriptional regulator [Vacuolonema iberomarrocanum]|uniref:LysR family transcriptional regulator n=1 Tax=Vacuolonema iberomarrocanum TaxID=3454632 RepID=UPI0019E0424A|nr:LysR family transcriptional regulator [filamentous cyanobacterium LEGE 07170]